MTKIVFALLAGLPLAGCVTTSELSSQELAYCERMEREMGTEHRHDHNEAKGMGMNPMNVTHARCREKLGLS
jgi:hypothetical protein